MSVFSTSKTNSPLSRSIPDSLLSRFSSRNLWSKSSRWLHQVFLVLLGRKAPSVLLAFRGRKETSVLLALRDHKEFRGLSEQMALSDLLVLLVRKVSKEFLASPEPLAQRVRRASKAISALLALLGSPVPKGLLARQVQQAQPEQKVLTAR